MGFDGCSLTVGAEASGSLGVGATASGAGTVNFCSLGGAIADVAEDVGEWAVHAAQDAANGFVEPFVVVAAAIAGDVAEDTERLANEIADGTVEVVDDIGNAFDSAADWSEAAADSAADWAVGAGETAVDAVTTVVCIGGLLC